MGIPYYFYTLYRKYANDKLMIDERSLPTVDHLFFDYNSMIHPCAHKVLKRLHDEDVTTLEIETEIIEECIMYTRYVLGLLKPRNAYVMIDGVAPRAKMNQQRERRYKSMFFKTINDEMGIAKWDSNKITPGTNFMRKIQQALTELVLELTNVNIFVSGSDECGEGEHKMMQYITLHCQTGSIMIYGLDADLIMLGLLSKSSDRIMLLRDNNFNEKLSEAEKTFTYLNIKTLKHCVCREIKTCSNIDLDEHRVVDDYIFICFLLGNDFLEHLPSITIKENGVTVLIKIYTKVLVEYMQKRAGNYLIDKEVSLNKRVNLEFLKDIFGHLKNSEDYFFRNVYGVYQNRSTYRDIPVMESYDNMTFYQTDCIEYNKPGYKRRYYSYYGITNVNEVCRDYIHGLHWVLGYYNGHEHNNWDWFYKHHATPFVSDLFTYLQHSEEVLVIESSEACTEMEQLFMVLPRRSLLEILQEEGTDFYDRVQRIFRTRCSKELEVYYPSKICVDLIHKEYLWQSKVFFNQFDKKFLSIFF